jgi:drug/metabolite transporter (DMT)-like permease
MSLSRILGVVLLVTGVLILAFGVNASYSLTEKVVEGVSGRYTEHTTTYIIGGIALMIGGGLLALFGTQKEG